MKKLSAFGLSDIGLCRPNNEDVWVALPEMGFFALADGMGGHQAGEVAAKEAIEHLMRSMSQIDKIELAERARYLKHAIEQANAWVYQLAQQEETLNGMGTTLCCLMWQEDFIVYAHVGDSRIYRFRNQSLELLTQDHSFLTKWLKTKKKAHSPYPYKNVITRAIGASSHTHPEVAYCRYEPGDIYFLCTDGLTDVLGSEEIEKILQSSPQLETACRTLIETAKFKGSSDNITILMIEEYGILRQQRHHPA